MKNKITPSQQEEVPLKTPKGPRWWEAEEQKAPPVVGRVRPQQRSSWRKWMEEDGVSPSSPVMVQNAPKWEEVGHLLVLVTFYTKCNFISLQ